MSYVSVFDNFSSKMIGNWLILMKKMTENVMMELKIDCWCLQMKATKKIKIGM